jgi:DNA-binding NarL/FixJ family response regulator
MQGSDSERYWFDVPAMNSDSSAAAACRRRIFLVDDHVLVREGLANLINRQNDLIVCGEAEDSAGAIAGIEKNRPEVALIDISLKNESGLELVKNLESRFPLVALIVLSMHDEALYAERALRAGARGYVMKRETTKGVLSAIRRVLEGGVYVSERVVNSMARRLNSPGEVSATSPVERLSDRELEIFRLLGQGRTTTQIADDLHLSLKTVQAYCARAKEKFGVSTLGELLRAAIRWEDATHLK